MAEQSGLTTRRLLAAIRRKCLDCVGGVREEVEECPIRDCPLHPYRLAVEQKQEILPGAMGKSS